MKNHTQLPTIVSREDWVKARKKLLNKEKAATRARDALNAERRRLPMVKMDKDYLFEGSDGRVSLLDLFEERSQLIVGHFMFDPSWEQGCSSCSAGAVEMSDGHLKHLHARDTTFVYISRAPYSKIESYKNQKGWNFPWYSSYGSDFNYDFHVTLDEFIAPIEYNYRGKDELAKLGMPIGSTQSVELPGRSCFLRVGNDVFHTYSVYARGLEQAGGAYYFLDETALGRQEDWEEPKGRASAPRGAKPNFSV